MTGTEIYQLICYDLCEDDQLRLGLLTDQQFIGFLNESILEFLKETRLSRLVYTQTVQAGISRYSVPEEMIGVDDSFVGGVLLGKETVATLGSNLRDWRRTLGLPRFWHEDQLPAKMVEVAPGPDYNGEYIPGPNEPDPPHSAWGDFSSTINTGSNVGPNVHMGLTFVGPAKPAPMAAISDPIPLIPDDLCLAYLPFGVGQRIFSSDSELKDMQAALYCGSTWREGISIIRNLFQEVEEDTP